MIRGRGKDSLYWHHRSGVSEVSAVNNGFVLLLNIDDGSGAKEALELNVATNPPEYDLQLNIQPT